MIGLLQKTKNVETMEAFQKIEDSMERWSAFTCGHIKVHSHVVLRTLVLSPLIKPS
jgi:hypothetical protein